MPRMQCETLDQSRVEKCCGVEAITRTFTKTTIAQWKSIREHGY